MFDQTNNRYEMLPSRLEGVSRNAVWRLGLCSSEIYVRFRSEATVDGAHFTDLGSMRYVDNIMPTLKIAF